MVKLPKKMSQLTKAQREVAEAVRDGAFLSHPYDRSRGSAWLIPMNQDPRHVQYRTLDALVRHKILRELEPDESGGGVLFSIHYTYVEDEQAMSRHWSNPRMPKKPQWKELALAAGWIPPEEATALRSLLKKSLA